MINLDIDVSEVAFVYSGKDGCACGCRGKYSYASQHQEWASNNRGYKVNDDEVNDKTVKQVVKKVTELFKTPGKSTRDRDLSMKNGKIDYLAAVNENGRLYMIHFVQ